VGGADVWVSIVVRLAVIADPLLLPFLVFGAPVVHVFLVRWLT